MNNYRLLFVEDDTTSLELLKALFDDAGYTTFIATNVEEAYAILTSNKIDLLIIDIMMSKAQGYSFCCDFRVKSDLKSQPIIIYSQILPAETYEQVKDWNATIFMRKPAMNGELMDAVKNFLSRPDNKLIQQIEQQGLEAINRPGSERIYHLEQRIKELEENCGNLEEEVNTRTQHLNERNEELARSNEEFRSINEELNTLNEQLSHSAEKIQTQNEIILVQKEEVLNRTEQNLKIIFANTLEEIVVLDQQGRMLMFNKTFGRFILLATGRKPEAGMFIWEMMNKEQGDLARRLFQRSLQGETMELEIVNKISGSDIIRMMRYSPVFTNDQVTHVTVISSDVTEKRSQEEQLRKSEQNLQAIFQNTTDSFILLDNDLNIQTFNENYRDVILKSIGIQISIGQNILSVFSPVHSEKFKQRIQRAGKGEKVNYVTKYGSGEGQRFFEVEIKSVPSLSGSVSGYCLTVHDSTALKKSELEILRLNKSLLNFQQAIFSSSLASLTDAEGNITFVNDNSLAINGYSRSEFLGKNFNVLNSGYHSKEFWTNMWQTISSGKTWNGRIRNKAKNGSYFWVDSFIIPFLDESNKVYQYLAIRHDITAQKMAEDDLIQSQVLLEESSKIAKLGCWVLDKKTGVMNVSKEMLSILEVSEKEFLDDPFSLYKHVLSEDLDQIFALQDFLASKETVIENEYRIQNANDNITWIHQKVELTKVINEEEKIIGIIQDITERKRIEETLRAYNERYEILSRATNDAIWDLNLPVDSMTYNHTFYTIFGYTENEIEYTSKWWESKIHPEDRTRVRNEFETAVRLRKSNWSIAYRMCCANNSYKNVYNRCYILYDGLKPIRMIGSLQDITARMAATEEIEKLSLVASSTKNGVMITDQTGVIEWVNESFSRMTGYHLEEIKGSKSSFLQGADSDPLTIRRISDKLKKREFISEEIINYTKTGEKFWCKLDISPVFDTDNRLKNFISIQVDISELKDYEKSITSIARELSNLIDNANVPIFGIDKNGYINEWNRVAEELMGFNRAEALGVAWSDAFILAEHFELMTNLLKQAAEGLSSTNAELPLITKTGKRIILLLSASPRRNTSNEITGTIFVGQNVTELTDYRNNLERKVENRTRELHVALEKEKELVQLKSQFISIASHEFRTPLTSIKLASGFIKKYKEKISAGEINEKLDNIEKQVTQMTYLLDDILLIGKAEAGKLTVIKKELDIINFLEMMIIEVEKNSGRTHRIELTYNLTTTLLVTDEKLLRNIFINLLTNAIKFSPDAKKVELTVYAHDSSMMFKVKDEGIGIPDSDLKNLFEPFSRGANVTSIQGTGLGLSIIKKAVDSLHGSVTLTSVIDKGTEIIIELPTR